MSRQQRTIRCRFPAALLFFYTLSIIVSGPVYATTYQAESSTAPVAPSAGMDLAGIPFVLLQFKYQPATFSENDVLAWTQRQVQHDQGVYTRVGRLEQARKQLEETTLKRDQAPNASMKKSYDYQIEAQKKQIKLQEAQIEESMTGVVFDRSEVENREPRFAAQQLKSKYSEHLARVAAALPDRYTLEFSNPVANYDYDFDAGILYNKVNTWAPCEMYPGELCLPNGWGSHFFATLITTEQLKNLPDFAGYFLLSPPRAPFPDPMNPNPYGFPQSVLGGGLGRTLLAIDHHIGIPYLKMEAGEAESMIRRPTLSPADVSAQKQLPGCWATRDCAFVGVIDFTVTGLRMKPRPVIVASLQTVKIFEPQGKSLRAYRAGDFLSIGAVQAAAKTKAQEEKAAQEKAAAEEAARYADFDILGIKLGMSLEDVDKIVRQHMKPTSEYRHERQNEVPPFGAKPFDRAIAYIRMKDAAPAGQKESSRYWTEAVPEEVITVTVERSADGKDEVLGVRRWLQLPKNAHPDAIGNSLREKYGKPEREQGSTATWGKVSGGPCRPSAGTSFGHLWELRAGQAIPGHAKGNFYYSVRAISTKSSRWKRLPDETGFETCGPAIQASYSGRLEVVLTDYKRYFERYSELFVSGSKSKEEEAFDIDL